MKYFKVVFGYEAENYVPIDETELEKAIYAHITGRKAIFSGGTVSGDRIMAIQPDYHRAMGWNRGYRLGAEDYAQLSEYGVDVEHQRLLSAAKEKVNYLMQNKQEHLIGRGIKLPALASPVSEFAKSIDKRI